MCIFSPLSTTVYKLVEWMWKMSKWSRVDVENEQAEWVWRISEEDIICVWQKTTFMCFCFVLIKCTNMSQTSQNERAEKIGVGGANLEWVEQMWAEQCGESLTIWRRCCCVSFYFRGQNF